jgi:hypothetical protein
MGHYYSRIITGLRDTINGITFDGGSVREVMIMKETRSSVVPMNSMTSVPTAVLAAANRGGHPSPASSSAYDTEIVNYMYLCCHMLYKNYGTVCT